MTRLVGRFGFRPRNRGFLELPGKHGGEALDLDSGKLLDLPKDSEERPERDLSQALAAEPAGLEVNQRRSWTVYVLPTNSLPPLTFAFQTASGASALLQIARFGGKPNSARLRSKMLQAATTVRASPREVVAEWLRRVKADTREAWALTIRSNHVGWGPYLTWLWEFDRIRPLHQLGSEEQAMVVSNPFMSRCRPPPCGMVQSTAGEESLCSRTARSIRTYWSPFRTM